MSDGLEEDLSSPRFAGDDHLEAIFDGLELMAFGWFGCSVKKVQQALLELGFDLGPVGVDGDFRSLTHAAVQGFQASSGLAADGVVGPVTLRVLQASVPPISAQPVDCGDGGGDVDIGAGSVAAGTGTLSVVVFLGEESVEDANVSARSLADPTARFGTTDASGRHSFGALPVGEYVVAAEKAGLGAGQTTTTLDVDDLNEVFIGLVRQGESRRPRVFGARPHSERGNGFTVFVTPHDGLKGITHADRDQEALDLASAGALENLNQAVEADKQRLQEEHAGLTLRFRTENFTQTCDDPHVIATSSEGEGDATTIIEEIQATCDASVHLVFESEEEFVE